MLATPGYHSLVGEVCMGEVAVESWTSASRRTLSVAGELAGRDVNVKMADS